MRKLEVSLVACAIAIVVLATSTLYFHDLNVWQKNWNESLRGRIDTLQNDKNSLLMQVDSLEDNNTLLQSENEQLIIQNQNLEEDVDELQNQVDALEAEKTHLENRIESFENGTEYSTLNEKYILLKETYESLEQNYTTLQTENAQLQRNISSLESQIVYWQEIAEENTFMFYYASLTKQRYGVLDLEEYLDRWQWVEGTYIEDVFDCSEMSAYIEWKLENEGYHTYIVLGPAPWGGGGDHAWLLVETSEGHYMPVEATEYDLVKWDDPYFDNYFVYDLEFETIFDALEYSYEEFDGG